ncbi:hypothetical protein H5410_025584 [Solanum commersonii]|uniref:Uncharacterized protein n=1 Tax=Solanum commersonii TaxID=4109 RepID=A0A9J5YYD2_SOLCO|nr:hypothetical protein H5410_025584 [Solanum commersonii]
MAVVGLDRFTGSGNPDDWIFRAERYFAYLGFPENDWIPLPFLYIDGEALDWFRWMYRNKQFWDWKHFKEKLSLCFRARTTPESALAHSQITTILTLLQKVQDSFSVMSNQLDNTHISIFNITGLSPTIVQEAAIADAIDSATTRVSEEIVSALGDEHSGHADQVFDESSHQIEDLVHEFGMAFDLVADNLVGLQMPLQATRSVEPPLLVVTDNFFSHEILISDFDEPIGVDGYVSLIPHDNVAAIAEFFPFVFNQSSLANFGDLAMCESVTDGLPTCHWFDTGQHVSPFIPFVFRLMKYGHHVSATEFDKNGYRPIIGAQGAQVTIVAGTTQKIAWEGASHNWFLEMSCYILAMKSGDSKMNQLFDAMSDKACKVFNVMSTSLLVRVLAETPKETGTIQQFHFKDKECLLISFGGQESIVSASHSPHALPRRYFDVNSLYSVLSRQKIDLMASNNIYVDIIFMKSTILEDVSKREIQSNDVRNDVKHVKFNEEIRHDECSFQSIPDNGWQVLDDVCALGAKNMPSLSVKPSSQIEPLGALGDKNLTVEWIMEHQNVSTDQCAYWCLRMIYISTDEISFWVDTIVCPMNNINCLRAFECISVTGIVTCKWFKVVQPIEVV